MKKIVMLWLAAFVLTFPLPALAQGRAQGPIEIIAAPVKIISYADTVEALGTARANETVVITANISEKVTEIHFDDGQEVQKGDLLVTLDKSEEQAELLSAQALRDENLLAYERAKNLQDSSALSKATLQQRQATLKQSEAAIDAIRARIEQRTITAPFDGILGLRQVSVGALVQPGDTITTIDDLSQIKVDFDVPSVFLSSLKPGLPITGKVEAFSEREFEGRVSTINTQIDPVTRTVRVRAVMPNPDKILKPGLLMTINLFKDQRETLVIPEEALIKRGDKDFVYIVEQQNGKTIARQTTVKLGTRKPGMVEVLSGLNLGDQIVSHGTLKLSDGAEITVRAVETEDTPLDDLLKQKAPQKG